MIDDGSRVCSGRSTTPTTAARILVDAARRRAPARQRSVRAARTRFGGRFDGAVVGPVLERLPRPRATPAGTDHSRHWRAHRTTRAVTGSGVVTPACVTGPRPADGVSTDGRYAGRLPVGGAPGPRRGAGLRAALRHRSRPSTRRFASASNFAVGVVVAHSPAGAGLGAYAVAYTVWLALGTGHRARSPIRCRSTTTRMHDGTQRPRCRPVWPRRPSVAWSRGRSSLVSMPLIAWGARRSGSRCSPSRRSCLSARAGLLALGRFHAGPPDRSLVNDTVFNCVQALGIGASSSAGCARRRSQSPPGASAPRSRALYGLSQFSVRFTSSRRSGDDPVSVAHEQVAVRAAAPPAGAERRRIRCSRGPRVGPAGLGGLKAAQNLIRGPTLVLIQAGGSIGLPEASRALEKRRLAGLRRVAVGDPRRRGQRRVGRRWSSSPPGTRSSTSSTATTRSS